MTVELTIDGEVVKCAPGTTLADAFALVPGRRGLAQLGCGIGNCTACVVLLNGAEVKACLTLARHGATVSGPLPSPTTTESLS